MSSLTYIYYYYIYIVVHVFLSPLTGVVLSPSLSHIMLSFLRRTLGRRSIRKHAEKARLREAQRATTHIPAAGDAKSIITCRVSLLDGTDVSVDLPVSITRTIKNHNRFKTHLVFQHIWTCRLCVGMLSHLSSVLTVGTQHYNNIMVGMCEIWPMIIR